MKEKIAKNFLKFCAALWLAAASIRSFYLCSRYAGLPAERLSDPGAPGVLFFLIGVWLFLAAAGLFVEIFEDFEGESHGDRKY